MIQLIGGRLWVNYVLYVIFLMIILEKRYLNV